MKRALVRHLSEGEIGTATRIPVLIRDPRDERYPMASRVPKFESRPPWRYYFFVGHGYPDHLDFILREYLASLDPATGEWDLLKGFDLGWPTHPDLGDMPDEDKQWKRRRDAHAYWESVVPETARAHLVSQGLIHYDQVIAIDPDGDAWHEGPHLLVEYRRGESPFDLFHEYLEPARSGYSYTAKQVSIDEAKRVHIFGDSIPELPESVPSTVDTGGESTATAEL
jgi:hypothetical protein